MRTNIVSKNRDGVKAVLKGLDNKKIKAVAAAVIDLYADMYVGNSPVLASHIVSAYQGKHANQHASTYAACQYLMMHTPNEGCTLFCDRSKLKTYFTEIESNPITYDPHPCFQEVMHPLAIYVHENRVMYLINVLLHAISSMDKLVVRKVLHAIVHATKQHNIEVDDPMFIHLDAGVKRTNVLLLWKIAFTIGAHIPNALHVISALFHTFAVGITKKKTMDRINILFAAFYNMIDAPTHYNYDYHTVPYTIDLWEDAGAGGGAAGAEAASGNGSASWSASESVSATGSGGSGKTDGNEEVTSKKQLQEQAGGDQRDQRDKRNKIDFLFTAPCLQTQVAVQARVEKDPHQHPRFVEI